eukprot:gnl/Chilomastix_cuspidata/263.p1 GENE.gnl/Chilomastix_cuspidata/263~~gnl/Chilomastix_cuspidata/263.p1  ORF type:complete len:204 (-),score=54.07 gnl/Chilomastix_cuspidata/263:309-920(-)
MSGEFDHFFKMLLIGDTDVGKSCLLSRFAEDTFTEFYISTIGVDFKTKPITVGDSRVMLKIWDTAGQERFKTITVSYYRGAQGIMIVYDITQPTTFSAVTSWVEEIERNTSGSVATVLIGNKADRADRKVSREEGQALADRLGIPFLETSAKTGAQVPEAFRTLTERIMETWDGEEDEPFDPASIDDDEISSSDDDEHRSCCK